MCISFYSAELVFAPGDMCLYGVPICHRGVPVKFFWFDVFVELLLHHFSRCPQTIFSVKQQTRIEESEDVYVEGCGKVSCYSVSNQLSNGTSPGSSKEQSKQQEDQHFQENTKRKEFHQGARQDGKGFPTSAQWPQGVRVSLYGGTTPVSFSACLSST